MKILTILLVILVAGLAYKALFLSFRAQRPSDYAETGPAFALQRHLSGPLLSEGVIFGPTGKVTTSFVARMEGEWRGGEGTLSEHFIYSNGREQHRKWFLRIAGGNRFTATADDIVGEAQGLVSGATVQLRYTLVLPAEAGGHSLDVTDWMYLTADGTIINRSEMRKFGVKVAELVATLRPATQP